MEQYYQQVKHGAVLLTVNQRLARQHSERFTAWQLDQGESWWETPAILPFRAWLASVHAECLASGYSNVTIMPRLLRKRMWQDCIDSDSALSLLNSEATAQAACQAWEVACAWQCFADGDEYLPLDQYAWQRWSRRYQLKLSQEGWIDEAMIADHLGELIKDSEVVRILPERIIIDGYIELPRQMQDLLNQLGDVGCSVHVIQSVPSAAVQHLLFDDDWNELVSVATATRAELEADASVTLGVVVPDLQKRRRQVLRAFDQVFFPCLSPQQITHQGRPYDLSIGVPLSDTGVVNSALLLLKFIVHSVANAEVSALLLSPYSVSAQNESRWREQLDRKFREQRVYRLTVSVLLEQLPKKSRWGHALKRLIAVRKRGDATLSEWVRRFSDWLELLGWPGTGLESEEYQALSMWSECLEDLQLLDDQSTVTERDALAMLRQLVAERVFQADTPNTPIKIMGRLESHGLVFDALWVTGMDSEQWPPTGSPSPFLPMASQKSSGVPDASAETRLALAEKEYLYWCSRAHLVISTSAKVRDGKHLEPALLPNYQLAGEEPVSVRSRFLRCAEYQYDKPPASFLHDALSLERLEDSKGPELPEHSEVRGGARLFEDQALCPFRAFALHRLHCRPLEEAGLGLDPRQHGTLLHQALELLWNELRSHEALCALDEHALDALVANVVLDAIHMLEVEERLRKLEHDRLCALVKQWLVLCEIPRVPFEVVSLEQRQTIEHGGVIMQVMLDRIDQVDGQRIVIDYKTGTSSRVSTWADERISNPQLPLYVLTDNSIQGASFAQVANHHCVFKGITSLPDILPKVKVSIAHRAQSNREKPPEQWGEWRQHWQAALDSVALEVREGLASVTPMKTACQHCELKTLCRIDPLLVTPESDEDSVV